MVVLNDLRPKGYFVDGGRGERGAAPSRGPSRHFEPVCIASSRHNIFLVSIFFVTSAYIRYIFNILWFFLF